MKAPTAARLHVSRFEYTMGLLLILTGLLLRVWIRAPGDFWEDETIAATHAVQPFFEVIIDTVRNDVHPPLYFLQLHFWSLLGRSDFWLILNSVFWSFAALASFSWVVHKIFGPRTALLATAVFAVMPSPVYMGDQLRMYAMLETFIIWAFYFSSSVFGTRLLTKWRIAGLAALLLAIVNTHAIGSIAVFACGLYSLKLALDRPGDRRALVIWLAIYGLAAACAVPWAVSGMLHDANLHESASLQSVLITASSTTIGNIAYLNSMMRFTGALMWLLIAGLGVMFRPTRVIACVFLVMPVLLSICTTVFLKPVFKWNFFSTLEAPFIALVLAMAMSSLKKESVSKCLIYAVLGALCAITVQTRLTVRQSSGYRYLADFIKANFETGDIVYIPQPSNFWGLAWYLDGPNWGSPLEIAAIPSAQWRSVYRKLGPQMVADFKLNPKSQVLNENGIKLLVGNASSGQAKGASRIWLVTVPRADLAAGYPPSVLNGLPQQWARHKNAWVTLYAKTPQTVINPR